MPAREATGEFEDRGSRFLARAFFIEDEAAFAARLEDLRAEHPKARHHCWAWLLPAAHRFHDDGEPGGTAGRPILQVLEGSSLVHLGCVVVRYFGGVKLGTGGLARAYGGAAARAVAGCGERFVEARARLQLELGFGSLALRQELEALCPGLRWTGEGFSDAGWWGRASLPVSEGEWAQRLLEGKGHGRGRWELVEEE